MNRKWKGGQHNLSFYYLCHKNGTKTRKKNFLLILWAFFSEFLSVFLCANSAEPEWLLSGENTRHVTAYFLIIIIIIFF